MRLLALVVSTLALLAPAMSASAQAPKEKVMFVLDWVVFGRHTPYFTALEKGYFSANGIDATIQRGYGSATSLRRLGAGQADFIFADFGGLVLARANAPARRARPSRRSSPASCAPTVSTPRRSRSSTSTPRR